MDLIVVKAAWDPEARVWFVETSDLPGLNAEAASVEALKVRVEAAVVDLLDEAGQPAPYDVPIEIIAHTQGRARHPTLA